MPLFDVRCRDCGCTSEVLVRSRADKPACPECGGRNVERLMGTFAVGAARPSPYACRTCRAADAACDLEGERRRHE